MAELFGADDEQPLDDPGDQGAEAPADEMTETTTEGEAAEDEDTFTDEPPPDDNAQAKDYKYWQAAYTKTRQRDRERYGKLEQEHQKYQQLLSQFYQDDNVALQVLRQRFPQLAAQLSSGTPSQGTRQAQGADDLEERLKAKLGDVGFLAPAIVDAVREALQGEMAPLRQQTEREKEAQRLRQRDTLMAELDAEHPGWEDTYATEMQELDQFLASDALSHPKYGNKYRLLLSVLNKDKPRIDAARQMAGAARGRVRTGNAGRAAAPNLTERIRQAPDDATAFRLAAEEAIRELQRQSG